MEADQNAPATRVDIQTVRTERQQDMHRIALKFDEVLQSIKKMEQSLKTFISDKLSEMTITRDKTISELETYRRESVTLPHTLDEHGKQLREHDQRIKSLESKS